jgi:hypothetical protein
LNSTRLSKVLELLDGDFPLASRDPHLPGDGPQLAVSLDGELAQNGRDPVPPPGLIGGEDGAGGSGLREEIGPREGRQASRRVRDPERQAIATEPERVRAVERGLDRAGGTVPPQHVGRRRQGRRDARASNLRNERKDRVHPVLVRDEVDVIRVAMEAHHGRQVEPRAPRAEGDLGHGECWSVDLR